MLESILPIYPDDIRGSVRHILILKDFLVLCSKLMERYCYIGTLTGRQMSRKYVLEEIKRGYIDIRILNAEVKIYQKINKKMFQKILALRKELLRRNLLGIRSKPWLLESLCYHVKNSKAYQHVEKNICLDIYYNDEEEVVALPEPFICRKMKTVLEFLKELFIIQLHFHIVLCQGINFALPILYGELGLIDRLFFWPERPEFGLLNRKVRLPDKLRDIQVELQRIVEELVSACLIVEAKYLYDQKLEKYYHYQLEKHCKDRNELLLKLQTEKDIYIHNTLEHSRLVGNIIKLDPSFAKNAKVTDFPIDDKNQELKLYRIKSNKSTGSFKADSELNHMLESFISKDSKDSKDSSKGNITTMSVNTAATLDNPFRSKFIKLPDIIQDSSGVELNLEKNLEIKSSLFPSYDNENNNNNIDKTINSLLEQSKNFSIAIDNSIEYFQETRNPNKLHKMIEFVEINVNKEWDDINSQRNFD